ncbi:MAG: endolytic transglycosylase MltG, partial [Candidatus Binatia bacterium]
LQSDPTVIYGLPHFDGNIRREDLNNPHPYNTYVHPGLPPGPIASPGKASLQAAVEPVSSPYLYFVAKGDGSHYFSASLAEHEAAVVKYQLKRPETQPAATPLPTPQP